MRLLEIVYKPCGDTSTDSKLLQSLVISTNGQWYLSLGSFWTGIKQYVSSADQRMVFHVDLFIKSAAEL